MSDDKNRRGGDRSMVSAGQAYEVHYFAQKHGISVQHAREMIRKLGNSRKKLEEAVRAET